MKSKYTNEQLNTLVSNSLSVMEVVRKLGLRAAGGNHAQVTKLIKFYDIDTSHFLCNGSRKGKAPTNKRSKESILIRRNDGIKEKAPILVRALLESGIVYRCSWCGISDTYNDKPIVLQVDHINGYNTDNRLENLRFLCPNCHSQTETFGSKNKNNVLMLEQADSYG